MPSIYESNPYLDEYLSYGLRPEHRFFTRTEEEEPEAEAPADGGGTLAPIPTSVQAPVYVHENEGDGDEGRYGGYASESRGAPSREGRDDYGQDTGAAAAGGALIGDMLDFERPSAGAFTGAGIGLLTNALGAAPIVGPLVGNAAGYAIDKARGRNRPGRYGGSTIGALAGLPFGGVGAIAGSALGGWLGGQFDDREPNLDSTRGYEPGLSWAGNAVDDTQGRWGHRGNPSFDPEFGWRSWGDWLDHLGRDPGDDWQWNGFPTTAMQTAAAQADADQLMHERERQGPPSDQAGGGQRWSPEDQRAVEDLMNSISGGEGDNGGGWADSDDIGYADEL